MIEFVWDQQRYNKYIHLEIEYLTTHFLNTKEQSISSAQHYVYVGKVSTRIIIIINNNNNEVPSF